MLSQLLTVQAVFMQGGGVETLRAIPWIFAWTQVRMVLPAWLGIDTALRRLFEDVSAPSPSCCVTPAMRCWHTRNSELFLITTCSLCLQEGSPSRALQTSPAEHDIGQDSPE